MYKANYAVCLFATMEKLWGSRSAQKLQTLARFDTQDMPFRPDKTMVTVKIWRKQSRPGMHRKPFVFKAYRQDNKLCTVTVMNTYIEKTKTLNVLVPGMSNK